VNPCPIQYESVSNRKFLFDAEAISGYNMPLNGGLELKCQNERIQETEGRRQKNERWGDLAFSVKRRRIFTGFCAKQSQFAKRPN